jgi:hypothetical protein
MLTPLAMPLVFALSFAVGPNDHAAKHENNTSSTPETPVTIVDNSVRQYDQSSPDQKTPDTHTGIEWGNVADWALVIVGGLTGLAIWAQAREAKEATKAMQESMRLQEAGMPQWVDVESLGCYIQEPRAGKVDPFTINLRFQALNNTSYPFDIQKIVTKIGMWADQWEVFTVQTNNTLAPQQKSRTSHYGFFVPTQSITKEWFKSGTVVTINGEITFKSCLGKIQTDYFGGLYRCGQIDDGPEGMFIFTESLGIVPERTEEKEQS